MDFSDRLDALQQRAAAAKTEVQAAAAESREQLRQRIDQTQSELNRSAAEAQQGAKKAATERRSEWAQMKADAAAKTEDIKAKIDRRTRQLDAKAAASDADWAESGAADALDFAERPTTLNWPCWTPSTPAPTPTNSPAPHAPEPCSTIGGCAHGACRPASRWTQPPTSVASVHASSRSLRFKILPVEVMGSSSRNSTRRGYL